MTTPPPPHRRASSALALSLLLPAAAGFAQQPDGRAAALSACPTVQVEIVDLHRLADGLKNSSAVGMLEKLRLKSAIDQLIGRMRDFHNGTHSYTLAQLQEQYDLLMMRMSAELQDKDVALHRQLCNAWEPLWADLVDRDLFMKKFS